MYLYFPDCHEEKQLGIFAGTVIAGVGIAAGAAWKHDKENGAPITWGIRGKYFSRISEKKHCIGGIS